jgi:predicted transcriptional regulator
MIRDILEVANVERGTTKTRIMYNANLSHDQMKHHLRVLTENNLLNYNVDTRKFKTSEKGLRVIEIYKQMEGMIKAQQVLPTQPPKQRQVQVQ